MKNKTKQKHETFFIVFLEGIILARFEVSNLECLVSSIFGWMEAYADEEGHYSSIIGRLGGCLYQNNEKCQPPSMMGRILA